MMLLSAARRRHIVSTYATVAYALQQMEEAARDGRSPTGLGAPLTPLTEQDSEPILAPVREIGRRLRQIAAELAPRELMELERPQGLTNALVWQSNLLDRIRVAIDGLHPARLAKRGAPAADEILAFEAIHKELYRAVELSRRALDAQMRGLERNPSA